MPTPITKGQNVLALPPGRYSVEEITNEQMRAMNLPVHVWHYEISVLACVNQAGATDNYKVVVVYPSEQAPQYNILSWSVWSGWKPIATATPPAVYDLPLAAGWGYQQKTCYFKTQDNVVTVNVAINATAVHHSGEIIATLPEGYRPMQSYEASATLKNPASAAALYIDTNGSLQNYGADISQGQMMYANISFVAA